MSRADQRQQTRDRITSAAIQVFAQDGFEAAATRAIAKRAGLTQGLLTYHFASKDELWKAAADRVFKLVVDEVVAPMADPSGGTNKETSREKVRNYVRFAARHPEVFHFMVDAQSDPGGRGAWLVDTHLRSLYRSFATAVSSNEPILPPAMIPHAFYSMVGAGSAVFALSAEAKNLCGLDATTPEAVETHAAFVARLLLP